MSMWPRREKLRSNLYFVRLAKNSVIHCLGDIWLEKTSCELEVASSVSYGADIRAVNPKGKCWRASNLRHALPNHLDNRHPISDFSIFDFLDPPIPPNGSGKPAHAKVPHRQRQQGRAQRRVLQ
jgi:hypothetical protein